MAYTTIKKPSDYFDTRTYSASGAGSVSDVSFQPDFLWFKNRTVAGDHGLMDAVRGVNKIMHSNDTNAEVTSNGTTNITAFTSNGFTYGASSLLDTGSGTPVTWLWKANGAGSANTDGSISSTVSASATSGFSIVSYTGNGVDGASIGHGLVNPNLSIIKRRDGAGQSWNVNGYPNTALFANDGDTLNLNTTAALSDSATKEIDLSTDSGTTCTFVDAGNDINLSGATFIGYFFKNIKGYSKVGSYTGNGSTDGTFVYLGFKPAFLIVKRTDATSNWRLWDSTRNTFNVADKLLFPDTSDQELTSSSYYMDLLSSGFKIRNTNTDINASGGSYMYMAFAENPFVTSTGVPATAR